MSLVLFSYWNTESVMHMCSLQQGFGLKEGSPENFHQVENVEKASKTISLKRIASQSKVSSFHGTYCFSITCFFQFLPLSPDWYLSSCMASLQMISGI